VADFEIASDDGDERRMVSEGAARRGRFDGPLFDGAGDAVGLRVDKNDEAGTAAAGMSGAAQARIESADDGFDAIEHAFLQTVAMHKVAGHLQKTGAADPGTSA